VRSEEGAAAAKGAGAQGTGRRGQKGKGSNGAAPARPATPSKNRKKLIASLERDIEAAESALASLEDELADPSAWASPSASARSSERHSAAKREVERLYSELETAGA
jgi:ATP-binding cassette subfamily F protein 3